MRPTPAISACDSESQRKIRLCEIANNYNFAFNPHGNSARIMSVSRTDISVIAALAQLDLEDHKAESYVQEMTDILAMIQQMQKIDTSTIDPMPHPQDIQLRLRPDELTEPEPRVELQSIAPSTEQGFYLVPKVLD